MLDLRGIYIFQLYLCNPVTHLSIVCLTLVDKVKMLFSDQRGH